VVIRLSGDPVVAIVVPTYNEERNIARLLSSISSQQGCSYSVVVVDQGSSDRTTQIARAFGCTVLDVPRSPFYSPPARSRNLGARSSAGTILLHLDADMELGSSSVLSKLESVIDTRHQAAILLEQDVASSFWSKCKALERFCYRGTEMEGARAATRELFEKVGGYDEDISSGEDFVITRFYQRHTHIVRHEDLVVRHHIRNMSLWQMLRKKFAYGKTAQAYLRRARESGSASATDIVRICLSAYVRNWRLAFRHPLLYGCIFALRALELVSIKLGSRAAGRAARANTLNAVNDVPKGASHED
jgi:glycosyltransferase involved in cell wall biosynthesis